MLDKIIAQEKAVNILKNTIVSGKTAQAYIFHGPRGVGKLFTAFNLAKAFNCLDNNTENRPCNNCASCKKINQHSHPDIKFIFPIPNYDMDESGIVKSKTEWETYQKYIESKINTPWKDFHFDKSTAIRIEQIRSLQKDIAMSRHEGRKKVYIFENFDYLTVSASNAFLKTLEEPPEDTHFILTVSNLNRLLPTILSRCQTIEFYSIPGEQIENYLLNFYHADPLKARLFSRLANGDFKKAINLFYDENLDTMDITVEFLQIVLSHDDLAYLEWYEKYFSKNTKNSDLFNDFVQYLNLWINDLQLFNFCIDRIVFINQINLIKHYIKKNVHFLEHLPKLVTELDDYRMKINGNVNQKLVLSQVYYSFCSRF